jgi:aminoglycoside phosphotransferase (APT) family kinase protein
VSTETGATDALDLTALGRYLSDIGVVVQGALVATAITGGRSNLTYRVQDAEKTWVLRRPPIAGLTPSAHDMGREYRIVEALQGTPVPVAPAVAYCSDPAVLGAPFALVGFVPGLVLRTQADLEAYPDAELAQISDGLIQVLVDLHAVSYGEQGLGDFGRPQGFFARQVRRWRQQWDLVSIRPMPDVERLHAALSERVPETADFTIVHGDYRVDNTLLDPADPRRVLALVDWEMSTIGDPLTDLAMMCAYQHPDFDHVVGEPAASTSTRWPGPSALVEAYASRSGRELSNFEPYLGLAFFKLAVIAEGISARHRAGAVHGAGFDTAEEAVPGLLAAGLEVLRGGL